MPRRNSWVIFFFHKALICCHNNISTCSVLSVIFTEHAGNIILYIRYSYFGQFLQTSIFCLKFGSQAAGQTFRDAVHEVKVQNNFAIHESRNWLEVFKINSLSFTQAKVVQQIIGPLSTGLTRLSPVRVHLSSRRWY